MPQKGDTEENPHTIESEDETNGPKDRRRRRPPLRSVVSEIMRLQADVPGSLEPELEQILGPVIDSNVELELEKQSHLCNKKWDTGNEILPSKSRNFRLEFVNKLCLPVLTGRKIRAEENTSISVALVDSLTGQVVDSGPEASAEVEILVLESDFIQVENWTAEEFNSKIVRERDGKRLLAGHVNFNLKHGMGVVGDVQFAHSKCWMKKHEYRLGAKFKVDAHGTNVREGKTEPFVVEDRRAKLYLKHHPPSLRDAVWRLEKIGKDGAFHKRLRNEKIQTVEDFLRMLNINPQRLKDILGASMSAKMWEITVEHARTCVLDKRAYLYPPPISQQISAVVFNVVGQLIGVLMEQIFVPADQLPETQKDDAHNWVVSAFEHWGEVVQIDDDCNFEIYGGDTQQDTPSIDTISVAGTTNLDDSGLLPGMEKLDCKTLQPSCSQGETPISRISDPDSVAQDTDNEPLNFSGNSGEEVLHTASRSLQQGFDDSNILKSSNNFGSDDLQQSSSSHDIPPPSNSILDVNWFGDCDLDSIDNIEYGSLIFPSPITSSLICDAESMIQAFREDGQFPDTHFSLQSYDTNSEIRSDANNLINDILVVPREANDAVNDILLAPGDANNAVSDILLAPGDANNAVNDILLAPGDANNAVNEILLAPCAAVNKAHKRYLARINAQRRWKKLFSIMRWFSVRRNVTRKTPFGKVHKNPNVLSQDINPSFCCTGAVNGLNDPCFLQIHDSTLKSQANLHNAVNDIMLARSAAVAVNKAQRRYLSKKERAQRRWRMLFSVMRWFSVERNVITKAHGREMARNFSTSSEDTVYSTRGMEMFGDDCLQGSGDMERRHEDTMGFNGPDYFSKSFGICDKATVPLAANDNEHQQLPGTNCSFQSQNSGIEQPSKLHSDFHDILPLVCSASTSMPKTHRRYLVKGNKARRRWRMLFSIARWFSVRRNVAGGTPINALRSTLPCTNSVSEKSIPGQVTGSLICGTSSTIPDICEDENLKVFNTLCSLQSQNFNQESQTNLHNAVNDILLACSTSTAMNKAQRRYLSKRNRAQRRWRMLFSVVRWFSVRRNVTSRRHVLDAQGYC